MELSSHVVTNLHNFKFYRKKRNKVTVHQSEVGVRMRTSVTRLAPARLTFTRRWCSQDPINNVSFIIFINLIPTL